MMGRTYTAFALTKKAEKLIKLCEIEGFDDVEVLIRAALQDGVTVAICMNDDCNHTDIMEPDQEKGWCEECQTNSMKAGLILAGLI